MAANFHPECQAVFLLAFADGTVAIYDAALILRRNGVATEKYRASSVSAGEVAYLKRLHTPTTKTKSEVSLSITGHDPMTGEATVTADLAGVASVALLPGYKAMAVTVGSDGRCCVVDFSQRKEKAVLLRSWHLRRPGTCLSVIYTQEPAETSQLDGPNDPIVPLSKDYFVAVGRDDGKVLLFDLEGTPLGQRILESSRGRIIDVEWAKKETIAALAHAKQPEDRAKDTEKPRPEPQADPIGTQQVHDFSAQDSLHVPSKQRKSFHETPLVAALRDTKGKREPQGPRSEEGKGEALPFSFALSKEEVHLNRRSSALRTEIAGATGLDQENYGADDLHDPLRQPSVTQITKAVSRNTETHSRGPSLSMGAPPIPPRPRAKAGGRLRTRRALKALEAAGHQVPHLSSSSSSHSIRQSSIVSIPKTKARVSSIRRASAKVFPPPSPKVDPKLASTKPSATPAQTMRLQRPLPPIPNRSGISTVTQASYHTAASQPPGSVSPSSPTSSGGSQEIVIDWAAGRSPIKPLQVAGRNAATAPVSHRASLLERRFGERRKSHISLSVSSSERPRSSSSDTVCQWPKYHDGSVKTGGGGDMGKVNANYGVAGTLGTGENLAEEPTKHGGEDIESATAMMLEDASCELDSSVSHTSYAVERKVEATRVGLTGTRSDPQLRRLPLRKDMKILEPSVKKEEDAESYFPPVEKLVENHAESVRGSGNQPDLHQHDATNRSDTANVATINVPAIDISPAAAVLSHASVMVDKGTQTDIGNAGLTTPVPARKGGKFGLEPGEWARSFWRGSISESEVYNRQKGKAKDEGENKSDGQCECAWEVRMVVREEIQGLRSEVVRLLERVGR